MDRKTTLTEHLKPVLIFHMIMLTVITTVNGQYNQPNTIVYDQASNRYFISNESGNNIMQVTPPAGPTFFVNPATFVNFPRGMVIANNILYVVDGSDIKGFSLSNGSQVFNTSVSGAFGLKFIAADLSGNLYVTDVLNLVIYRVNNTTGGNNVFVSGIQSPSGIVYDAANDRLLVGHFQANAGITAVSLSDSSTNSLASSTINQIEGITLDDCNNLYVAASDNNIYMFDNQFQSAPVTVSSGHNQPMGIYYNPVSDTLAIPNRGNNTVQYSLQAGGGPSAVINTLGTDICEGSSLSLSADSMKAVAINWSSSPAATFSNPDEENTDFDPGATTGLFTIYFTATSATCPDAVDSIQVNVVAQPVADGGGPYTDICKDDCLNLAGNGMNGAISWDDGGVGGSFNPPDANNTTYCPPIGYTGPITITQTITPASPACSSATDQVVINAVDSTTAEIFQDDTLICSNDQLPLVGIPTNEDSVQWSSNPVADILASNTNFPTFIPSAPGQYTVTYTVFSASSCPDASAEINITVDPAGDTAVISGGDVELCGINSADLSANDPGTGTGMWTVESGSGDFTDATAMNTTINNLGNGANVVRWTISSANCPDSFDEITITVADSTHADFGFSIAGNTVTFTDSSTNPNSWAWDFGDGNTDPNQHPMHTYAGTGNFTVCLTAGANTPCPNDSICKTVAIGTSSIIPAANGQLSFAVYPNPADQYLVVDQIPDLAQRLQLYDPMGRLLLSRAIGSEKRVKINLAAYPTGIYFLRVYDTGTRQSGGQRIVIAK